MNSWQYYYTQSGKIQPFPTISPSHAKIKSIQLLASWIGGCGERVEEKGLRGSVREEGRRAEAGAAASGRVGGGVGGDGIGPSKGRRCRGESGVVSTVASGAAGS